MPTAIGKDRFGLVTVEIAGEPYVIVDIGMRMLTPRELARCQGFPDDYKLPSDQLPGSKTTAVRLIGNSVCPQVAEAIVRANVLSPVPA
jgi:DNA (cytosine-5)-methyltransferase 1